MSSRKRKAAAQPGSPGDGDAAPAAPAPRGRPRARSAAPAAAAAVVVPPDPRGFRRDSAATKKQLAEVLLRSQFEAYGSTDALWTWGHDYHGWPDDTLPRNSAREDILKQLVEGAATPPTSDEAFYACWRKHTEDAADDAVPPTDAQVIALGASAARSLQRWRQHLARLLCFMLFVFFSL